MSRATRCQVCLAPNQSAIEAVGERALRGDLSWRAAAREAGMEDRYASLKTHMESHFVEAQVREVEDEMEVAIKDAVQDLYRQMRSAPAEVKPLYAAAIRNLQGLRDTKPSQQHLIAALKTIQEMTGMRQEQRLMLHFAEAMFGVGAPEEPLAIEAEAIEVEPLPLLPEAAYVSTREEV